MTGWAASLAVGRVQAGEQDTLVVPRLGPAPGKRGVIVVHGAGALAYSFSQASLRYQVRMNHALAAAGFTIFAPDLGGTVAPNLGTGTWGNDTVVARIESARLALVALGCAADRVCLVGTSMGGLNCFNYARTHPSKVASLTAFIPIADITDAYVNGFSAPINAAWGVAAVGELPAHANPNTDANAASIASSGASIAIHYSTADTVARPTPVTELAAKLGIMPTVISTSLDHSDAQFEFIDPGAVTAQLQAAGA